MAAQAAKVAKKAEKKAEKEQQKAEAAERRAEREERKEKERLGLIPPKPKKKRSTKVSITFNREINFASSKISKDIDAYKQIFLH